MPVSDNLVHETSTTTGTSNLTVSNVSGKQSFNGAFSTGGSDVFWYFASNRSAAEWEYGTGHMSDATTLVRDTVIASTNSNSAVSFSAGTKDLTSDIPYSLQNVLGKHTIYIPAAAMIAATTSGAASAQQESSSNKINAKTLAFDASADEYAHFNIPMPTGWNEGTITFQVFWSTTASVTDGVAWGLQAVAVSDGDAIDASWGTPIVVTDDAQSAIGDVLVTSESSAVTIGGTPAAGDLTFFRIFRDVSDANDDMTEDALLIGVKVFYTIDAPTDG